jgi:WD40 repeat protein
MCIYALLLALLIVVVPVMSQDSLPRLILSQPEGYSVLDLSTGEIDYLESTNVSVLSYPVWNQNNQSMYAVSNDNSPKAGIYSLPSGATEWIRVVDLEPVSIDIGQITSLTVHPDGRVAAVLVSTPDAEQQGFAGLAVYLFDLASGEALGDSIDIAFQGIVDDVLVYVTQAAWSPDGDRIAIHIGTQIDDTVAFLDANCLLSSVPVCDAYEFLPYSTFYSAPNWYDKEGDSLIFLCEQAPVCKWNFGTEEMTYLFLDLYADGSESPRALSVLDGILAARVLLPRPYGSIQMIDLETQEVFTEIALTEDTGDILLVPAYALAGILEAQGAGDD